MSSHPDSRRMRLARTLLFATIVAAPACSSGPIAAIHVDQPAAFFDTPVAITVTGLSANSTVVVRADTRDAQGVTWSSSGTFTADVAGTVDLRSVSSRAGSYHGVDAMGLFWSMSSAGPSNNDYAFPPGGEVVKLTATANGSVVASATLVRNERNPGVIGPHLESLSGVGFYGVYDAPANADKPRPAVLAFGGSGGGLSTSRVAYALATHGYPSLAIAYFAEPGLPTSLSSIPLEYFARALEWLRAQPAVDPSRVIVYGVSRGSEAALLLGVHYPNLVHGVIALVPSNVAICSFPVCNGPAWTLDGKSVPYTVEFDNPAPDDVPAAVIPVEKIQGPVLLDCGGHDQVWVSCPYADAIIGRLDDHHDAYRHELLRYPDAGHGIGLPVPYAPIADTSQIGGASTESNPRAREQAWPAILDFLAQM